MNPNGARGPAAGSARDSAQGRGAVIRWQAHEETGRAAGRKIRCPMLLVSTGDDLDIHGDPETIWRPWAAGEMRTRLIHSGHHQAEEAPDELALALPQFLGMEALKLPLPGASL